MSVDTIIIIAISAATLVATALGIVWGYKWHKAGLRQNLEIELHHINAELADVEVQITKEEKEGNEKGAQVLSQLNIPNPNERELTALEEKKAALLNRKAEIEKQLKQL